MKIVLKGRLGQGIALKLRSVRPGHSLAPNQLWRLCLTALVVGLLDPVLKSSPQPLEALCGARRWPARLWISWGSSCRS